MVRQHLPSALLIWHLKNGIWRSKNRVNNKKEDARLGASWRNNLYHIILNFRR